MSGGSRADLVRDALEVGAVMPQCLWVALRVAVELLREEGRDAKGSQLGGDHWQDLDGVADVRDRPVRGPVEEDGQILAGRNARDKRNKGG